jgi:hypothetical protein
MACDRLGPWAPEGLPARGSNRHGGNLVDGERAWAIGRRQQHTELTTVGPDTDMRRPQDRLLVIILVVSLSVAGCSGTSGAAKPPPRTVGTLGSTLQADGAQYTLDQVVQDPTQMVVAVVLTAHNTSRASAQFGNLSVTSLVSDATGRTYTSDPSSRAIVQQCEQGGFFTPVAPGQSQQGCEFFTVPPGTVPVQLELLVHPTLRWQLTSAPPPGTVHPGTGTGTGTGSGTGTATGAGPGPVKKKHHPHARHPKKPKAKKVKAKVKPKVKAKRPTRPS